MENNTEYEYKIAFAEVLKVLSVTDKKVINAIPKNFIKFLEENKDSDHETVLDPYLDLKEQPISPKARAIIALIYRSYIASEEDQKRFAQRDQEEIKKEDEAKKVVYNPDKIFNSIKNDVEVIEEGDNQKDPEIEMALELIDKGPIGKLFVKLKYFFWNLKNKNK